jgi:long-subunit acyl-CoA synthetase (AMP-forming)
MDIERPKSQGLSEADLAHLEQLRTLVRQALADGKLSKSELEDIKTLLYADQRVTVDELVTLRTTIRQVLGNAALEYDWQ